MTESPETPEERLHASGKDDDHANDPPVDDTDDHPVQDDADPEPQL